MGRWRSDRWRAKAALAGKTPSSKNQGVAPLVYDYLLNWNGWQDTPEVSALDRRKF